MVRGEVNSKGILDGETWKFCGIFNHHYDWNAKEWRDYFAVERSSEENGLFHKCSCCEKIFADNDVVYVGMVFVKEEGGCKLRSFCKKCAYEISDRVIDYDLVNGEVEITTWEKKKRRCAL